MGITQDFYKQLCKVKNELQDIDGTKVGITEITFNRASGILEHLMEMIKCGGRNLLEEITTIQLHTQVFRLTLLTPQNLIQMRYTRFTGDRSQHYQQYI